MVCGGGLQTVYRCGPGVGEEGIRRGNGKKVERGGKC